MKYVLDANAAIAALNDVGAVRRRLADVPGSEVGIPIVAVGELLFGAYKSKRRDENLARVAALRRTIASLPLTDGVIERYAATRAVLESRGAVKIDFDLIIACTAVDLGAILVTNDQALLDGSIGGLRTENWMSQVRSSGRVLRTASLERVLRAIHGAHPLICGRCVGFRYWAFDCPGAQDGDVGPIQR